MAIPRDRQQRLKSAWSTFLMKTCLITQVCRDLNPLIVEYQHYEREMSHNRAPKGIKHHQEKEDHHRNEEKITKRALRSSATAIGSSFTELRGKRAVIGY